MGGKRLLLLRSTAPPPPPSSHFDRVLLSRIDSSNVPLADADADAVVQNLRARYPRDYSRIKLLPFSRRVRTLLHQHHRPISTNDHEQDDEEDDDHHHRGDPQTSFENNDELPTTTTTKKKRRKRPHDDDEEEEEDDDAVFESPVEPQFDVTRSMLLAHYQKKQQQHLLLLNNKNNKKKNKQSSTTSFVEEVENAVERRPPTPRRRVLELWGDGSRTEEGPAGDVDVKKGEEDAGGTPRFRDFGGIDWVIEELVDEVIVPLCHPQLPRWLGVRPMAGILLHGPPGCGKTRLAHAIANETGVPFYKISATEVVSGISGESEGNIRELFRKAYRTAPSIVFIDEIDAIASKRENMQKEMERRIVTQLMTCMDESHQKLGSTGSDSDSDASDKKPGYVLVIGATNRPDAVDPALRRPGRFDREIVLGVPNENARKEILKVLTGKLRVEGTLDLLKIARSASGFVGADLKALVNKAGNLAMKRIINRRKKFMNEGKEEDKCDKWWKQPWTYEELQELSITMSDFEEATKLVQPSLRREGFSSIPNVKWDDVGGLNSLQKEFERYIVQHIKNPDIYLELGVKSQTGFLLYGPPGCGKTLIAKAVAHEAGANFIHIKGPELLNKYVGESELAVRTIFSRARTCSPCVLFFDEIDALTTKRGKEGGWVVERLLNQLLIELDGADERHGVHVIGATNRLEVVDPAILRPGRLGKVMYVPLPDADERILILKALVREKPLGAAVDLDAIGHSESCRNLSGADLAEVVKEAAMLAVEERLEVMKVGGVVQLNSVIKSSHFEQALKKVSPSVSEEERMYYEVLSKRFRGT